MGGAVGVDSIEGFGTTFSINLSTKTKILNPIYFQIQNYNNLKSDQIF
jgi:hypothetical protein